MRTWWSLILRQIPITHSYLQTLLFTLLVIPTRKFPPYTHGCTCTLLFLTCSLFHSPLLVPTLHTLTGHDSVLLLINNSLNNVEDLVDKGSHAYLICFSDYIFNVEVQKIKGQKEILHPCCCNVHADICLDKELYPNWHKTTFSVWVKCSLSLNIWYF